MQKNKHMVRALTASALVLGLVSVATTASAAVDGIAGTRHNLGSSNRVNGVTQPNNAWNSTAMTGTANPGNQWTNATDEICVFCHTPHGSNATSQVNAPIWNKLAGTASYTVYSSGTMQGTASLSNGNMSLACLSCHDGTQAMDAMVNRPGSSGFTQPGAKLAGSYRASGGGAFMWYGSLAGKTSGGGGLGDGFFGTLPTGTNWSATLLGTDLSNDHPIGMAYCGGGQTATGSISGCTDTDFNPQVSGGNGSFYIGTGAQKNQMRTYGNSPDSATVECGSCHDPHSSTQRTFLRTSNTGSAVCLTCHAK